MQELYPLKFQPIYKEKIWGGNKIVKRFGRKNTSSEKIGESWELSAVEGDDSIVTNGYLEGNSLSELVEIYMGDIVGDKVYEKFGDEFPLLIKFIEANDKLSLQVHPNDEVAIERHHSYGKTEMWFVLDNEPDAELIYGFRAKTSKEEFRKALETNTFEKLLNIEKTQAEDVFYIPAGKLHALGRGLLVVEIQQTSDVTYRVSDWGRTDQNGKERELHIDLALDVIDYSAETTGKVPYKKNKNHPVLLVESSFFKTNLIEFDQELTIDYNLIDSFVVYICIKGTAFIVQDSGKSTKIKAGETILIPADLRNFRLIPEKPCSLIETYLP
jgi:Phosphomannose isomerase